MRAPGRLSLASQTRQGMLLLPISVTAENWVTIGRVGDLSLIVLRVQLLEKACIYCVAFRGALRASMHQRL